MWLPASVDQSPEAFLLKEGQVFARFDERTQDSGNVSFGVERGGRRYFVKTAGQPSSDAFLDFETRAAYLRNGAAVAQLLSGSAHVPLHAVVETTLGPMLVYDWVDGLLLGGSEQARQDPLLGGSRFRALPARELAGALDRVFDFHTRIERLGWVACDFYDSSLIYDFDSHRIYLFDLDLYRDGPFTNDMGRMFGSSRFMAPEEFELGARIDQKTTVFTMGRCLFELVDPLADTGFTAAIEPVRRVACAPEREDRFASVAAFLAAWRQAVAQWLN